MDFGQDVRFPKILQSLIRKPKMSPGSSAAFEFVWTTINDVAIASVAQKPFTDLTAVVAIAIAIAIDIDIAIAIDIAIDIAIAASKAAAGFMNPLLSARDSHSKYPAAEK